MANVGQGEPKQTAPKQAPPPPPKQELQPHPTMDQLSGVQYCVNSPPPWSKNSINTFWSYKYAVTAHIETCSLCIFANAEEAVLLGFQHYILTLGNTVFISTMTVSQMGGDNVSDGSYLN